MTEIKFEIDPGIKISPDNYKSKLIGLPVFPAVCKDVLDFDLYPSIRDLAVLCQMSYSKYKDIVQALKDNKLDYELLCCVEKGSHHGSAFFRNGEKSDKIKRHRQLVIAFRGTEDFDYQDWEANLEGVVRNQKTAQINSAITFALKIVEEIYNSVSKPDAANPLQIIVTGHSLGGWLAQLATFAIKHLQRTGAEKGNFRPFLEKEGEFGGRCHPACVTFDSPGTKLMLQYICDFPEIKFRYDHLHLDIVNYVICPNAVNVVNPHYGDIVQISSEQIEKALELETVLNKDCTQIAANAGHTYDFHSIKRFVEILNTGGEKIHLKSKTVEKPSIWETIGQFTLMAAFYLVWGPIKKLDWDKDIPKTVSSQLKFKQVNSWPVAVFEGYNTKPDNLVNNARWKIFRAAIRNFRNDPAFTEYSKWLKNKHECNCTTLLPGSISLSAIRLSEDEKGIVEQLERIRYWKEYLAKDSIRELEAVIKDREIFSTVLEKKYEYKIVWDRILFESEHKYRLLKNFAGFYKTEQLKGVVEGLTNYKNASFILDGAWYIDSQLLKYRGIGFSGTDLGIQFNPGESNVRILTYDCEHSLRLQLLKWMFIKRKQNLRDVLILKHDPRFPSNFFESLHNIEVVIVDCTECEISDAEIKAFIHVPSCKYVWMKHTHRRIAGNSTPEFHIDQSLLDAIFSHKISVQGQMCSLKVAVGDDKRDDFEEELNADGGAPKSILDLFFGNSEVVKMPKTVFEDKSTYFEIGRIMNDTQLQEYYSNYDLGASSILVFFAAEFSGYIVDRSITDDLSRTGISVMVLHDLGNNRFDDAFVKFRNICRAEPFMTVDLISCTQFGGTHEYKLMYQYNPAFYKKRQVLAPTLKIGLICKYLDENNISWDTEDTFETIGIADKAPETTDETCLENLKGLMTSFNRKFPKFKNVEVEFVFNNRRHGYYLRVTRQGVSKNVKAYYRSEEIEDNKIFTDRNFLILSDEPGMGKSTTIYKLAEEMLQKNYNTSQNIEIVKSGQNLKLLIFIELKTLDLSKLEAVQRHSPQFFETFLECVASTQSYNVMTRFLVKHLCDRSDATLICDGFDEMTESNKRIFRKVLRYIRELAKIKLIVTTRPHASEDLQEELWTLAHNFVPLDNGNVKIDFLMTLWSSALRYAPRNINDCTLRHFAQEVIRRAHTIIIKNREKFLGVPLQLRMLAVVFLPTATEYIDTYPKPDIAGLGKLLDTNYPLSLIYHKFIARKFELYVCNKIGLPETSGWRGIACHMETYLEQKMQWLACKNLNWGNDLEQLCVELYGTMVQILVGDEQTDLFNVGIVCGQISRMEFVHRTFAEFFVAKLLLLGINRACFPGPWGGKENTEAQLLLTRLIWSKLLSNEAEVVRLFLNTLIEKSVGLFSQTTFPNLGFAGEQQDRIPIFKTIIDQGQVYLLDFLINICDISDRIVVPLLEHCEIAFTRLLLITKQPPTAEFVLLKRLHKFCTQLGIDFANVKFLSCGNNAHQSIDEAMSSGLDVEEGVARFLRLFEQN